MTGAGVDANADTIPSADAKTDADTRTDAGTGTVSGYSLPVQNKWARRNSLNNIFRGGVQDWVE